MAQKTTTCPIYELSELSGVLAWAEELKQILTKPSEEIEWGLMGRAATFVGGEADDCLELLEQVAAHSGIPVVRESFESLCKACAENQYPDAWNQKLIYISHKEWADALSNPENPNDVRRFLKDLLVWLLEIPDTAQFVLVTAVAKYPDLPEEMRVLGGFDRRFHLPEVRPETLGKRFLAELGHQYCDESMINQPAKVGWILSTRFDSFRRRSLLVICCYRMAKSQQKPISLSDLVWVSSHGTHDDASVQEFKTDETRRSVAVHEAGHALVAMLDSDGKNIPDLVSIISQTNSYGVVVESMQYHQSNEGIQTYRDALHSIRVCLAGRVAEELVFGIENVRRNSARSDLSDATGQAKNLVAYCGFSSTTGKKIEQDNLAVVGDTPTPSEEKRVEWHARRLLAEQYGIAKSLLEDNQILFKQMVEALLEKSVLFQDDLYSLCSIPATTESDAT